MANKKLRVGVIGVGGIATTEHLPHWKSCPVAEVVALADVNPAALEAAANAFEVLQIFSDWKELVADPTIDVVDITAPNAFHAPMSLAAMEAGKHVFCEKPMAVTAADAEAMLAASRRTGRKLMINHVFRFNASLLALRRLADDHLGRVYHAHAQWTRRRGVPARPTFLSKALAGGGPLLDLGIHVIDLAGWCMGFPQPLRVSAVAGKFLAGRSDLGGIWGDWDPQKFEVEDFGLGLFHFAGGATLLAEASWLGFQSQMEERRLRLFGDRGGFHWPENVLVTERDRTPIDMQLVESHETNRYKQSVHGFAHAVAADEPVPIPPEETIYAVRLIEGLYRSAAEGREITF